MNDDLRKRRNLVRNRWFKAVTMINNPSLIVDRFQRRYHQRLYGMGYPDYSAHPADSSSYQVAAVSICVSMCSICSLKIVLNRF